MSEYKNVPVEAARKLAEDFGKSIVIITCWDDVHSMLHTTTYGATPKHKEAAARGGEIAASALGMDLSKSRIHEDYRESFDAEKYAALKEAAIKFLPEIKSMASQVISKPDNFFARLATALENGL